MKLIYTLFIALSIAQVSSAQTPIIYRPGPGLNDSTDQGGPAGGKDTWVHEGAPTLNYADLTYIEALPISNCNATHCVAYIQFDLSTLPAAIDSAYVVFKHFGHTTYCYSACAADFWFARITQPWYEQTLTYADTPTHDTAFYGPIHIAFPNDRGVQQYDITSAYNLWRSGAVPNYGMAIYSTTVDCNNAAVFFSVHSSDDTAVADRPYLKVYPHTSTGIAGTPSLAGFNLYPNPAAGSARMDFMLSGMQLVQYQLCDMTGRTVLSREHMLHAGANSIVLPLTDLPTGIYIYTLITKDGTITGRLVKE